jgi:putative membrane protein insertion efficiency factor
LSNYARFITLQLLGAYKWAISPLLPPACRFLPTCSEYAMEAVERYGARRGLGMAFIRILRCHPLARSGYDPVVKGAAFQQGRSGCPGGAARRAPDIRALDIRALGKNAR